MPCFLLAAATGHSSWISAPYRQWNQLQRPETRSRRPSSAASTAVAMNNHNTAQPLITDERLGRILGACAVVGIGLVCASLAPAASPLILGRCAAGARQIISRH